MLWKDLTHDQLLKILEKYFYEVAKYLPKWMADHRPEWMAEHLSDWMAKHEPDWMAEHLSDWMNVPRDITDILYETKKPEEPMVFWQILATDIDLETVTAYRLATIKDQAKAALDWLANRLATSNVETRTAMDYHNLVMQILEDEKRKCV